MSKYDDASWHYEGNYPKDLPIENAAIHIGMFLAWCVEMDFVSEELREDEEDAIAQIKAHEMSGAALLWRLDGKLIDDDLSDEGNGFATDYYEDDTPFGVAYGNYGADFCAVFDEQAKQQDITYESLYHVADTKENYLLMKAMLDTRFAQWRHFVKG